MSKSTINTYKHNSVWPAFAKMIKARDTNNEGYVRCCTCPKILPWDSHQLHAGHLVPGRTNNILFDEQIVHGQCSGCNEFKGGATWEYQNFMRSKYNMSHEQVDELFMRKNVIKKFTKEELQEMKKQFESKTQEYLKQKGLL